MGRYAIRRILLLIPTLLAVYTISFLLIHATPGGPWDDGDKPITGEALKALNEKFGINKPLWRQYSDYLWNALHGDFGLSFAQRGRTVSDIFKDFFPVSLQLGLIAIILGVVAVRRASRGLAAGRGRAIAGIILGALGLLLGVALVVAGVSILNSKQGKNLTSCLKDAGTDQSKVQACQTKFRDQTTNGS